MGAACPGSYSTHLQLVQPIMSRTWLDRNARVKALRKRVERDRVILEVIEVEQVLGAGQVESVEIERVVEAAGGAEVGDAAGD